jgi:hypothetical protein
MFDQQVAALESTLAELETAPAGDGSVDEVLDALASLESVARRLSVFGLDLLHSLDGADGTAHLPRLRDALANALYISGADAGSRIASAAELAGDAPALAHTGAALRAGLIGTEAVRIIRDTVAKLPDTASTADREFFDVELATVAVAQRPEVLRREAAKLLAGYDAVRNDPITRERVRAARCSFTLGPQDADGMSRGRFCLDPEARAYLEALLAKAARPGLCNPADPAPVADGEPDPVAAAGDTRTTAQRNHDAVKTSWRMLLASGDLGQHRGLPVTAIVTMTLQQLEAAAGVAVAGGGSTVPVEVALRMAAHAHHYLYIYDEHCGREIFLGRSQRLASADQRIVLHAVDGGCSVPGCDQPAYNCEAHHLLEWTLGGTTDIDRLTLLCKQNHKHAGEAENQWRARRRYDQLSLGRTVWYPPKSVDRQRKPRINTFHKPAKSPPADPEAA